MSGRFDFETVDAVAYDELRPGYAREAIDWVVERAGLDARPLVVDLGAGTGQLSRRLVSRGFDVVAVEPAANMRQRLAERLPSLRVVDGTAEALPFDPGSVDLVVVGNAFHHFDREVAFAELRRVLTAGGVLAMLWAWPLEEEQRRTPAMDRIFDVVQRARTDSAIMAAYRSWEAPPAPVAGFTSFERREFPLTHVLPAARLAELYGTSSDIASMPIAERTDLLDRIRSLAHDLPETLHLPSRTVVDLCQKDLEPERGRSDRSG